MAGGEQIERAQWLACLWALEPTEVYRRMPGRETFPWRPPGDPFGEGPAATVVVKRYRGDALRDRGFDGFHLGRFRSAARREFENLQGLRAEGFPVPHALLCVEDPRPRPGARSALVMAHVPHDETLRSTLAILDAAARAPWLARLANLVGRLHGLGWYHRDLYLQHVVVHREEVGETERGLTLLDLGRARHQRNPRRRWFVKDLAALLHSAPPSITPRECLRFLGDYLAARGLGGPEARRTPWARAILKKAARLGAHAPRHVDPRTAGAEDPS